MSDNITPLIRQILPEIVELRHQFHQIPELGYAETKTAALIAETLRFYGYTVRTGIAKTGITAVLDTGRPGNVLALRADMDGLPILEATNLPYASQHPGVMHACGHDGHIATLLAVASVLQQCKARLCGKVKFIYHAVKLGPSGPRCKALQL